MKIQGRRKIAILMLFAVLFMNLMPISSGNSEASITPIVSTAHVAAATVAPGTFFMESNAVSYANGSLITMTGSTLSIGVSHSSGSIPSSATIRWLPYDEKVITVSYADKYKADVTAVGPGYSQLAAIVTYDGIDYQVYCQIYVPLKLDTSTSANMTDGNFGIVRNLSWGDGTDNVGYQLSTESVSGNFERTHYLVKLQNVKYKSGVTNNTVATPSAIMVSQPSLTWSSSDETVVKVDESGILTAVGAGCATVTVKTTTTYNGESKSIDFPVFVSPIGQVSTSSEPMKDNISFTASGPSFTINTNAAKASNLVWTVHKGSSIDGEKINPDKSPLMDMNVSDRSGNVTFTNVKAGTYFITARPTDLYSENSTQVNMFTIEVKVGVFLPSGTITMTVGDYYDIIQNSNLPPNEKWYKFRPLNETIATVDGSGIITGKASGSAEIILDATELGEDAGAKDATLTVNVVDGINLNMTSATIYVGSTIQLILNATNSSAPITWTSSNPEIAMVDEDGLVTGMKAGDAVITVKQVINGVTKTQKCNIKVISSVTKITLDPIEKDIAIGDNLTINATVTPKLNNLKLIWVSSDESVVKISTAGDLSATVTGVNGGVAVISAINKDNVVVGSCLVRVYQPIESITLSETDVTVALADKKFQLYAAILPVNAQDQQVIWKSTDPSVVTVDENGLVTLKKPGKASIVVTSKVNAEVYAICKVTVTKSVTGITLDHTSRAMYVGETFRMTYVIKPNDSSNASVVWSSSNPSIVTVDKEGLLTARSVGTAVIILKTADGGYMATCTVTVSRTATAVKLDVTKLTMNVGDYYYLETKLTPADSTETTLTWDSSEKKVATVSKTGKVIAKSAGTTVILVKTKSGSIGYCTVTVLQPATGITISSSEETIYVGDKIELEASVLPDSADDSGVSWESSNEEVATVNAKGEVTGVGGGVAMISVTSDDGEYKDYCMVTVEELITSITLNRTWYRLGRSKSYVLKATINGEKATNKQLEWSSSDDSVVSVDEKGRIKGKGYGTATITVVATDGSEAEASCFVRVCRLVSSIDLNVSHITLVQGKSYQLKAKVLPSNATYKKPKYSTSKKDIAIVDKNGKITALSPGNTIITAKANDSSGVKAVCYVNVIAPIASTGISVSESEVVMSPGETKTVTFSLVPNGSTDSVSWSSDNQLVASVGSKSGKITAKATGTANITIMTESGRKGSVKVYVVGLSKTQLTLTQYSKTEIELEVDGLGAQNLKVRWDVENQEIATVSNGEVTARAIGTTNVYAVVNGRRLTCKVTVTKIP